MLSQKIRLLLPYAIVVFLGYVGFSLPLPILPEMFLDAKRSILPSTFSIHMKTILLGIVLAAYPAGQLIGSPILGIFSDKWGRKKVVIFSLVSTAIGYILTALATTEHSVVGIFFGLLLCGFSEGNVTIAQSVIGDISHAEDKVSHFGWINFFSCIAFIIGPLLGGWLADPENNRLFSFATPFWLGSILSILAVFIIWRFSTETKKHTHIEPFLRGLKEHWKNSLLRKYYLANFFLYFSLYSFWNCIGIYLQRRFNFSTSGLAYVMAYDSLFFALGLIFLVPLLSKKIKPFLATGRAAIGMTLMLFILIIPATSSALWWTIPPIGLLLSILMTNAAVMVSDAAHESRQGQALGSLQSVQVMAGMFVGILGGLLAAVYPALPLIAGAIAAAVCSYVLLRRKNV